MRRVIEQVVGRDGVQLREGLSEPAGEEVPDEALARGEDAAVTLAQDGETIQAGLTGEGVRPWSVTRNGMYTLTHTTYTNGVAGKVETATFVVAGLDEPFGAADVTVANYAVDVGVVEMFTTMNGKRCRKRYEVDFVVNNGNMRFYIQSAWDIPDNEKREQETFSLRHIGDNFRKVVVTGNPYEKPWTDRSGITFMGIVPFLLDPKSLETL